MKKQPILWLTCKLCPGFSNDLSQVDDSRKITIINRELKRLNIDIAALEETRLQSNDSLREQDYTFFWQGKQTMTLGPAASATLVSAGWMRMSRGLTKPNHRVSWHYPRSCHWHQLDPFSLVSSVPVVTTVLTATPQWALFTGHDIRIKQAYTVWHSLLQFHGFVYRFIAYLAIYCYMQYYFLRHWKLFFTLGKQFLHFRKQLFNNENSYLPKMNNFREKY